MTKHSTVLVRASLATLLALIASGPTARADIFKWEYINPANPSLGKQPSSTLAPDGAGQNAVPNTYLYGNLTMAYLIGADLTGANASYVANLSNADLSQANLTNAGFYGTLAGANLSQANLTNASIGVDLTNANFSQANLTGAAVNGTMAGANFTGAQVRGTRFHAGNYGSVDISLAQLYSTASYQDHDLTGIEFLYMDLAGANFAGQNLTNAFLQGTSLANANLSQANLTDAVCTYLRLTGANLSQANLTNAHLSEAWLTGANLTGAEVRGASFNARYDYNTGMYFGGLTAAQLYSTASYQAHDLTRINLNSNNLTGWNFAGQNLTNANLSSMLIGASLTGAEVRGANFGGAEITAAQLYSTASYQAHDLTEVRLAYNNLAGVNLANQNLTNANFDGATLTGASFNQANLTGAHFYSAVLTDANFNQANLTNVLFSGTLTNANFSQANLTNADFSYATLTSANLAGAEVRGATFTSSGYNGSSGGLTPTQLYSTASYQAHDLTGINLGGDYTGVNLVGQNLTNAGLSFVTLINANFSQANLRNANFAGYSYAVYDEYGNYIGDSFVLGANLTNANLSGADARGANFYLATLGGANTTNLIQFDGHIAGLDLTAGASLIVRDYDGGGPIVVEEHLAMDATGTLQIVFDADPWDSTISFAPGIPVALGGALELIFAPGVNVATQSGRTIDLFDWTGVTPTGAFTVSSPYTWDLTNLYTTGEVTLAAAPSLPGDFNHDGTVDAADYVMWRKTGINGPTGYDTWRSNFGQPAGSGANASANATVPEPASLVLCVSSFWAISLLGLQKPWRDRRHSPRRARNIV